jgi:hypothetical protein
MKAYTRNTVLFWAGIVLAGMLAACATHQARDVTPTTFLGDYSMLKEGGEGRAVLVYIDPQADFKSYHAIMMEPVRLYASGKHEMEKLTPEDRQIILNYADAAIREQLGKDYKLVTAPGPGVMRLRVAITEAEDANVTLDTISTIVPIGLALGGLAAIGTGEWAFTGSAGIEAEGLDSVSGKRLFAAVDRRTGAKVTGKGDKFDDWRTVKNAIDYWASKLRERLAEKRAK